MSSPANMYRVGDYVFFEINTASPYQIRRIEELNKTPSGNVEAKVMCFYRRRDIGQALLKVIDGRAAAVTSAQDSPEKNGQTDPESSTQAKPSENAGETATAGSEETPTKVEPEEKMETDSPEKTEKTSETEPAPATEESTVTEPAPPATPATEETREPTTEPEESKVMPTSDQDQEEKTEKEPIEPTPETTEQEKPSTEAPPTSSSPGPSAAAAATEKNAEKPIPGATSAGVAMPGEEKLSEPEKHRLLHRELFLSRQIETLPATHIRGKCTVTLLNELETPESYLNKEDAFFYSLVYDPAQKTILADKGEIRVGDKFQAEVPDGVLNEEERKTDRADQSEFESLIFHPHHQLTDRQIDQFLVITRAVGTLARAFDMNSATKYAGLHTTVAAASRDVTLFQAMVLLHQADYDIGKATSFLVPPAQKQWYPVEADTLAGHTTANLGGPLMCRDQMEEWSAAESNLFEEALEKYGKDFNDIRQDFLPWKSLKDIVEYYYMWKTTDRYIQQKRVKAAEAESRLKQVYIPTYAKTNPNAIGANTAGFKKNCEGCSTDTTEQWYAWGPVSAQLRLCKDCWSYWKKYGGLKRKHKLENFDKLLASQPQDAVQGMIMPRPGDRLVEMPDFGGRVQRCSLPGCSMQFANLQTLNQHLRRDHGLPWAGQESSTSTGTLRPATFAGATAGAVGGASPLQFGGMQTGPMRNGPRTRPPVFLRTTLYTKAARRLAPKQLHNPRHAARNPFEQINAQAIRAYCQALPPQKIQKMARVLVKMGLASASSQAATFHNVQQKPQQSVQAQAAAAAAATAAGRSGHGHGKPGHPNVATVAPIQRQQQMPQKRPAPGASGSGGQPPTKRVREQEAAAERGGDALFVKWINTPDDYYFHRTKKTKSLRRILTTAILRKMGRQPYRMHASTAKILIKHGMVVNPNMIK